MIPEKVIRDGKVAVLYSPGYGAGWSTWYPDHPDYLATDKQFIEAFERSASGEEIRQLLKTLFSNNPPYEGGWGSHMKIAWVPVGTPYYIHEYDGDEHVVTEFSTA